MMNALDELLSSTARVDDITPEALHNGRAAVERATASLRHARPSAGRPQPPRRPSRRRRGSKRGMSIAAAVAAAAAVLAGATVTVLSRPSGHSGNPQVARKSASPSTGVRLTAAIVLRKAGKAAGAQQGGWPNAAYWHVTSVYESGGKTYHRQIWLSHYGNGVLEDSGEIPGPVSLGRADFPVGGKGLTWAQLYALPTDPAKLESVLWPHANGPGPSPNAELYTIVGDLLRESPAPPALREALYEVAANIPGVVLVGHYKDALGRTGTAVERDGETLVIDPNNGQLLADIEGNPDKPTSCGKGCSQNGIAYTYVSEGPAKSAPALP